VKPIVFDEIKSTITKIVMSSDESQIFIMMEDESFIYRILKNEWINGKAVKTKLDIVYNEQKDDLQKYDQFFGDIVTDILVSITPMKNAFIDQEFLYVYKGDFIYRFMIITKPELLH